MNEEEFSFDKEAFNEKVRTLVEEDSYDKVAAAIRPYIRVRTYEDSFADDILAVRQVTDNDLHRHTDTDSFYVEADVEQPTATATVANFRDRPYERYIGGERFRIPLGKHQTDIARKNKMELKAYDYDILADAADKDANELKRKRDLKLVSLLNDVARINNKDVVDIKDDTVSDRVQIEKQHVNNIKGILEAGTRTGEPNRDKLEASKMLINHDTRDDFGLLDLNQLGDSLTGEVFTEGFTRQQVQGVEYMSSQKREFLTEHERAVLVQFGGGNSAVETVTVEGENFDIDNASGAAGAAEQLAQAIQGTTPADGKPGIVETDSDGNELRHVTAELYADDTVRLEKAVPNGIEDELFKSEVLATDFSSFSGGVTETRGYDRWDIMWCFPDPEFIGELVRMQGQDVESEVWKTDGENEVNRRSWEHLGFGIGNVEAVVKQRIQRERLL
jgi:hypothetical protein